MASSNVSNWDEPLSSDTNIEEESNLAADERKQKENMAKLQSYVDRMVYRPVEPPKIRSELNKLSKPKKLVIMDNMAAFGEIMQPNLRGKRLQQKAEEFSAITTDQLQSIVKEQRNREHKREQFVKRKQEVYYDMLTKLERQCRAQYLNVFIKKFSNFIAKLATTMRIPPQLVEPYSRMQRGIFCNILLAIGVQPSNQAAIYYTSREAVEYEVAHKLAHALLSLVIKALDSAATKTPGDIKEDEADFQMDNYIRDRLMCAAEKKVLNSRALAKHNHPMDPLTAILKKCEKFNKKCS